MHLISECHVYPSYPSFSQFVIHFVCHCWYYEWCFLSLGSFHTSFGQWLLMRGQYLKWVNGQYCYQSPTGETRGMGNFLTVCQSVSLSVRRSVHSVFTNFSRYWLATWYTTLYWHNTDQFRLWARLTYFYMSYYPLLIFCFPDFLSRLLWFWVIDLYMNLSSHNTDHIWLLLRLTYPRES